MSLSVDSRYLHSGIYQPALPGFGTSLPGFAARMPVMTSPYITPALPPIMLGAPALGQTQPNTPQAPSAALETLELATLGMFSPLNVGASSGKNFFQKGSESSGRLLKRKMVAKGGQAALEQAAQHSQSLSKLEGNVFSRLQFQPETMKVLKDNFGNYNVGSLFGFGMKEASLKGLTTASWLDAVKSNFSKVSLVPTLPGGQAPTLGNYLKYGVTGNHARGLVKFLASGKGICEATISGLNMGFAALRTGLTAQEAFRRSQAKGDGFLTSIAKSVFAGAKDLAFFLIGYEVGALAFSAAAAAIALPGFALVGGLVAAGFAGVGTSYALKSVFGNPISDPDPSQPARAQIS